MRKENIGFY